MNFLNIHILQTLPFSNLNRDDAGSPKAVIYGGTNRARLSSQSLKRAARTQFEAGSTADMTSRTKFAARRLEELVHQMLAENGVALTAEMEATIKKKAGAETRKLTSGAKEPKAAGKASADPEDAEASGDTLVWLAEQEIVALARKIADSVKSPEDDVNFDGWVRSSTSALTIAGFGRMFANAPNVQTEAAIQVAHAFTTHTAVTEVDYFTAVDDLRKAYTGDEGSGHLDLAEYTSGVFYRYLNVDRRQLADNWTDLRESDARARLIGLFQSVILALPTGKTNTTAPQTLPNLIVTEETSCPVSFADAFEASVPESDEGFAGESRRRFLDYQSRARSAMPSLFGASRVLDLTEQSTTTLDDLAAFSADWALGAVDSPNQ